jgi:hypothetical protein
MQGSRSRAMRPLGAASLFIVLFTSAVTLTGLLSVAGEPETQPAPKVVVIGGAGERLSSLFEGVEANPFLTLEMMLAANREMEICRRNSLPSNKSFLWSFFAVPSVYAHCMAASCGGSYWVPYIDSCDQGGGCWGQYSNPTVDYETGDPCSGAAPTGQYCGSMCECGAVWTTCESC